MRGFADLINAIKTSNLVSLSDIVTRQPTLIFRVNDDRENILHISAQYTSTEIFDYIVNLHPDLILSRNIFGWNAFHCAIVSTNIPMIEHIGYKYPTLVNKKDNLGSTAEDLLENKPQEIARAAFKVGVITPEIEDYLKCYTELFYSSLDLPFELKRNILKPIEQLIPEEFRFILNDTVLLDTMVKQYFKNLRIPLLREIAHDITAFVMRDYRIEQTLSINEYNTTNVNLKKLLHSTFRICGYKFDWNMNTELRNDIRNAMLNALKSGATLSNELLLQSIDTWVQKITQRQISDDIKLII